MFSHLCSTSLLNPSGSRQSGDGRAVVVSLVGSEVPSAGWISHVGRVEASRRCGPHMPRAGGETLQVWGAV